MVVHITDVDDLQSFMTDVYVQWGKDQHFVSKDAQCPLPV
jgi:hypothetical protein